MVSLADLLAKMTGRRPRAGAGQCFVLPPVPTSADLLAAVARAKPAR